MRVIFFFIGCIVFLCTAFFAEKPVGALESWSVGKAELLTKVSLGTTLSLTPFCSGTIQPIQLGKERKENACVFGETSGFRVARFAMNQGSSSYAVSAPHGQPFYDLMDVCVGNPGCVYAADTDTFVVRPTINQSWKGASMLSKFTKSLTLSYDVVWGRYFYSFRPTEEAKPIKQGENNAVVASIANSKQGPWVAVEFPSRGFGVYNTQTNQLRRVEPWSGEYGLANDPSYELAVTNDGKRMAVMGSKTGMTLYDIDSRCGDLYLTTTRSFAPDIEHCKRAQIEYNTMFPGFQSAHRPQFSSDGLRLSMIVRTTAGYFNAVIGPEGSRDFQLTSYVALGDSFTSGEGDEDAKQYQEMTNEGVHKCRVSRRSYPYLVGVVWQLTNTKSVACSGAQTIDITQSASYQGQEQRLLKLAPATVADLRAKALKMFYPGIIEQVRFVASTQPEVVSIGIGGNDAGFLGKLKSCLNTGVCEWAADPRSRAEAAKQIDSIQQSIEGLIDEIKAMSPASKVIVIGYPRIISEKPNAPCKLLVGTLLSNEERTFIDRSTIRLNDVLKRAATSRTALFAEVGDAYEGERLCEGSEKAMNGLSFGTMISPVEKLPFLKIISSNTFHPTAYGHERVSKKITENVSMKSSTNLKMALQTYSDDDGYWGDVSSAARTVELPLLLVAIKEDDTKALIRIPDAVFKKNQTITLKLGDFEKTIDYDETTESVAISLEGVSREGFYTVSLRGVDDANEPIHVYEIVPVDRPDIFIPEIVQKTEEEVSSHQSAPTSPQASQPAKMPQNHGQNERKYQLPFSIHAIQPQYRAAQEVSPNKETRAVGLGALVALAVVAVLICGAALSQWYIMRRISKT